MASSIFVVLRKRVHASLNCVVRDMPVVPVGRLNRRWRVLQVAGALKEFNFCRFAILVALLGSPHLEAQTSTTISANVAFTKVNQNPWTSGDSFENSWVYDDLRADLQLDIPPINASASGILADFLGLPEIGFAKFGGTLDGSAGLDLGYAVNGGRMNISYPGRGFVDFATSSADTVISGFMVPTQTSFTPGLLRLFLPGPGELVSFGSGYDAANSIPGSVPGAAFDQFFQPTFQTYFPNAAAWATFDYDLQAGVFAEAGLVRIDSDTCIGCARRSIGVHSAESIELVNVNTNGVEVIGAGRVDLFGQDFALGGGTLTVDYPDVSVAGTLQSDGSTVAGNGAKPILSFNADLEKLIPFVGAFLNQAVGPFNVTLLNVAGGPILSLYQDFQLNVLPTVTLKFDTVVERVKDGVSTFVNEITTALGELVNWRPLLGSSDEIKVQTIFSPKGNITNETGFSIGYEVDIDALSVGTPFGSLGPIDVATLTENAAIRLPALYRETFPIDLPNIVLDPVTFKVLSRNQLTAAEAPYLLSAFSQRPSGLFQLTFTETLTGASFEKLVEGSTTLIGSPVGDGLQEIFIAANNVLLDFGGSLVDLGRNFCVVCIDGSGAFALTSPSFFDDGERLYLPDLSEFRRDNVDLAGDPNLNRTTYREINVAETTIGEIERFGEEPVDVSLPGTLALLGLGIFGLGFARRRQRCRYDLVV